MIRSVVALFVFAVFLCGYIVLRPSDNGRPVRADTAAVTRAQSDGILGPVPNAITIPAAAIQAPLRNIAPAPTNTTDMSQTAANVLAGLGLNVDPAPNTQGDDPMYQMTAGVLSGIGAITGKNVTAGRKPAAAESPLEMLVVQALKEGQSDSYIDTIVNEAARAGQITVPQGLATADGKVDTSVLLSSIITRAQIAAGGAAPATPDVATGDGTGIELRTVQNGNDTKQVRLYTVTAGDSLGALAIKFYGSIDGYDTIYQANRDLLSSPNAIQVGQRLSIPAL